VGQPADHVPADEPTVPSPQAAVGDEPGLAAPSSVRMFGSIAFFRLWLAQVASSLGDWIGFVAITALAARVGGSSPEAAIGIVLSARLIPGFFLAPVAGVLVDRWDRKRVMVICDIGRGSTFAVLPWIDTLPGLVLVSLVLEVFTMLWAPAKEASVPNLVRPEYLANANSLSLAAAYGTFPVGTAVFAALAGVARWLGGFDVALFATLQVSQENLAIYFDVVTFYVSAGLIATLTLPGGRRRRNGARRVDLAAAVRELREGFAFIHQSRVVRAVILAFATGLAGGGMLVPLGPAFSSDVLGSGTAGFGLLLTALGTGVAVAIVTLSVVHRALPLDRVFVGAAFGAGASIILGASMSDLRYAVVLVAALGVCAGSVYVLGFTIIQVNVDDALRGRIFATFQTLARFCLILAFTTAPFISSALDGLSSTLFDRHVELFGWGIALPGVRLTLWFGGLIIIGAGVIAMAALRDRSQRAG
jgi:dTMP kinase